MKEDVVLGYDAELACQSPYLSVRICPFLNTLSLDVVEDCVVKEDGVLGYDAELASVSHRIRPSASVRLLSRSHWML